MRATLKLENGLRDDDVARTLMRTHAACMFGFGGGKWDDAKMDELQAGPGWMNVAVTMIALYAASGDQDLSFSYQDLAAQCRQAYYRGAEDADPPCPFATLAARERLAWECVARHAAGVTQADDDDLDLRRAEAAWGDAIVKFARDRRLTLEPAIE